QDQKYSIQRAASRVTCILGRNTTFGLIEVGTTRSTPSDSSTTMVSTRKHSAGVEYAILAATTLQDVAEASHVPFLKAAATASSLMLTGIQAMKTSQAGHWRIVDLVHRLLCIIVHIYLTEGAVLPPKMLNSIGKFARTLKSIQISLQCQQELGKIKRFVRQHETSAQLQSYEGDLQVILDDLNLNEINGATQMVEFASDARQRHEELMAFLAAQNDEESSEYSVSLRLLSNSSTVFSVLPPYPKIFHGRDSELTQIVTTLLHEVEPAHIAILGSGGMGKTSLSIAALHHPEVVSKYDRRHFISCESAFDKNQLLNIIADHLGLKPSKYLTAAIITHFVESGSTLLVLDNLETTWEQIECRTQVEELLAALADLPQLALLATMRGAERPAKIKWTPPFSFTARTAPAFCFASNIYRNCG
ncbi:hypothetical protein C8R43DRAFT_1191511, partial [Mycena crocata]